VPLAIVQDREARQATKESRPRAIAHVLVVDDDFDARLLYGRYFQYVGMSVVTAGDGLEAVSIAERALPDVIVMDISLPGIGGDEAICLIKANPRTRFIPIVAITAHGLTAENKARAAGCDAFLTKPCLPEQLVRTVRGLLPTRPL
jgi:two-component system cell cycle response regulator DivK